MGKENGNGNGSSETEAPLPRALVNLRAIAEAEAAQTPPPFPEPLEAGPQEYSNPRFWRPANGGIPLAEDPGYQRALKLLDKLPPASESAKKYD